MTKYCFQEPSEEFFQGNFAENCGIFENDFLRMSPLKVVLFSRFFFSKGLPVQKSWIF